ncbi:MAG: DUF89 family protein [Oscillospiraceae bacterium]|nr:DUF89 family protein [Oscillospiraceae bacterium]
MEKMGMDSYCYLCYLNRNIEIARTLGDEATATAFAKRLMALYLSAPENATSPWFGPHVADLFYEFYGITEEERYREEKQASNAFVLQRLDAIREAITTAEDPVYAGLQWAILGNYIDFSALRGEVSFRTLEAMMQQASQLQVDKENYRQLCRELETGHRLLYLCDNAGEIGMDRLFAEAIAEKYPHLEITVCVRGGAALNDATREDAAAVGMPFPVIDNGTRIAGTQIELLGEEAKQALEEADVILAKGQANVETMLGCGYNVYYAFLVKCQRFIDLFGKEKFTPMLFRERSDQ